MKVPELRTSRSDHRKKSGIEWTREKATDEVRKLIRVGEMEQIRGWDGTDHTGLYRITQEM